MPVTATLSEDSDASLLRGPRVTYTHSPPGLGRPGPEPRRVINYPRINLATSLRSRLGALPSIRTRTQRGQGPGAARRLRILLDGREHWPATKRRPAVGSTSTCSLAQKQWTAAKRPCKGCIGNCSDLPYARHCLFCHFDLSREASLVPRSSYQSPMQPHRKSRTRQRRTRRPLTVVAES
jgi:hypothetical protein